ncbi:PREDICTED: uncharacterized protein LOC106330506 [Brassica oleracea var. oleracea]|uniref:uncharacterized protein LOC106330506 n=1 Tax=Brassica oleracea var. oleracea TaxID=109376 RepID=UPI0006A6AB5B|nr:PREDICTED: uncharacterized protein LOC106330506 [Brassica oleracea var. oleracea]
MNGVSEDAFKLKLFPFSLGDKAHQWEKTLPSATVTTWDECKRAFLDKFFSTSRTAKIRNEIYGFQQKSLERFSEAWERFKGYWSQCPHHGFSKVSLLSTFYREALSQCRNRLDTASNGFFLGRTEEEAEELTKKELKSLQAKLDLLLAENAKQEKMNFVGDQIQEAPPVINEARNEKTMIYEFKNIHAKIDENYSDLNNKYMQLASHLKALENQVASMPSSSKQPMGSLPGKLEKNLKESCNVVFSTTSPKIELSDHEKEEDEIERLVCGTEFGEVERFVVATAEAQIVKDAATKVEATNLQRTEHKADNKLKEVKLEEATKVELSPYDKLPFPQRVLTKAQKMVLSKFRKDLSDVGVKLPEISGMREAHVQMMLINDILDHQAEVAELLDISIMKIDPPIPPKFLPKIKSQGMFTLPCYRGKLTFDDALVDSGASVYILGLGSNKVEIDEQNIVMRKKSPRDLE